MFNCVLSRDPASVLTPEPEHEHGFAFLRKVAIDQHINTRNRWDDIIPVIKKYSSSHPRAVP